MVKRTTALILFGLVAAIAIGSLATMVHNSITGQYVTSGGGRYTYAAPKIVQMQPEEACRYIGFAAEYPVQVFRNEYGSLMTICRTPTEVIAVPLVQTVVV